MQKIFYVLGPPRNAEKGFWLYDFLEAEKYNITSISRRKEGERPSRLRHLYKTFYVLLTVLFRSSKKDVIFYYDATSDALYMGLLLYILQSKKKVHLMNFMGADTLNAYSKAKRIFIQKAFNNMKVSVNNINLAKAYSTHLNIPLHKFAVIPDSTAEYAQQLLAWKNIGDDGYVFIGGNTRRDYPLVLKVAAALPHIAFVIVTSKKNELLLSNATANVTIYYDLPFNDFIDKIAKCRFIFLPLISDTQGGQLVLFQGALLKKAAITTNNMAIHTYFDERSIIIIPKANEEKAISNVKALYEDGERIKSLGNEAYQRILQFAPENIFTSIRSFINNETTKN